MEDDRLYQTKKDVKDFFFSNRGDNIRHKCNRMNGIIVDNKLRRDILTSVGGATMILDGRVVEFKFEDLKGGVWNLSLED